MTNQEQQEIERVMYASFRRTGGQTEYRQKLEAARAGVEWCRLHHLGMPRVTLYDPATGNTTEEKIGDEALFYVLCLMVLGLYQGTYATDQAVRAAVAAIAPVSSY